MASFKEIKERINSVRTTRKITSAMKMVSAAKLHKAQKNISGMLPYSEALESIMEALVSSGEERYESPLAAVRETERVAIVAFSSDSSLAGAFNSNISKELARAYGSYSSVPKENIQIYTIGKKVYEAAVKSGIAVTRNYEELASRPDYAPMAGLAGELMQAFMEKKLDRVEIIYHHFKSAGTQELVREDFLPLNISGREDDADTGLGTDYILEPSRAQLLEELIPQAMKMKLYTALLDSGASEHAARVIAMQTATDNADELLNELTIQYNKSRQQAITNELLDMVGGASQ